MKQRVITIFSEISPDIADQLPSSVDIVHRLGPHLEKRGSPRRIIVQFISRTHRDKIWKDARLSAVLKREKIRILEDLSLEMKEARSKLWPLVEQARKEGKKAGFQGPFLYINGKKSHC